MSTPNSVMIFAAGFGTRMGALTRDMPKPMIPVAGKPLIDHALDLLAPIAPDTVVANLHYKPEPLRAHLEPKGVLVTQEQPEILDTGGGLRAALPLLGDGPVYTMNSDAIWSGPNPMALLRDAWDADRMDALLVCVPLQNCIGRKGAGDFAVDAQGHITRGGDYVYGGVQIIKTNLLHDIDEKVFSLNLLWNQIGLNKRLFAVLYPGKWADVGHPEGIALAEHMLAGADV